MVVLRPALDEQREDQQARPPRIGARQPVHLEVARAGLPVAGLTEPGRRPSNAGRGRLAAHRVRRTRVVKDGPNGREGGS